MSKLIAVIAAAAFLVIATQAQAGGISEKLLLSSAWCSFSYNQNTGYSKTTRVTFSEDGTYSLGGRGEGYSSGAYGSVASQNDSGGGGRWKVVEGELFISEGDAEPQFVRTVLKRNSNGYPIITTEGIEYAQCR